MFALGIMPYITASIILQLLAVVIPRLEALRQEGQTGQAKITQYTRYLTIGLAILQSTGIIALARSHELIPGCNADFIPNPSVFTITTMVIIMTAGTAVIMWLGELITDRGVGNGMSVMIFTQIIAVVPGQLQLIYEQQGRVRLRPGARDGRRRHCLRRADGTGAAPHPDPVRQAHGRAARCTAAPRRTSRSRSTRPASSRSSSRPRCCTSPQLAAQLFGHNAATGWPAWVDANLVISDRPAYVIAFFVLIVFFTYFYVSITFNPTEVADGMKKGGGFIPGIRPGGPTAGYLSHVLSRLTAAGSLYLAIVALIPVVAIGLLDATAQFPLGGTSILIMVGVGLDTVKQIESQLQQRNYEGFLR